MNMKLLFPVLLALSFFLMPLAKAHEILKVAVVDTGLNLKDPRFKGLLCRTGHKDFTDLGLTDTNGHGTFVAGLIKSYGPKNGYCLLVYKYYDESFDGETNLKNEKLAIAEAIKNGAKVINFSAGGPEFNQEEYDLIHDNQDVTFVVAAGNERENLDNKCDYYPACYHLPNLVVNSSCDRYGVISRFSNYGRIVSYCDVGENVFSYAPNNQSTVMNGTSFSTAIRTGKIVKDMINAAK